MSGPSEPISSSRLVAAATDRGRARVRNEDAHRVDAAYGVLVVADGMGGHPAGDIASALAVEEIARRLRASASSEPASVRMREAVVSADAAVREVAAADASRQGMGTTVAVLLAPPGEERVVIGHVGDSRAYLFERGRVRQLTRDHTWVEDQIAAGRMTREQARGHRWGHVLTRAVGVGDAIAADVLEVNATPGQIYLLCTDGLTNMLTDLAIERTLGDTLARGLEATAWALVDAANDRGGIDNITVALLGIG